jgi:4-amino-4-deoxy-L-arabinose transferase-like glycosyltransferase
LSARRKGIIAIWVLAILLGVALRALPLTAARPYIAYVDEGNFLHSAFRLLRTGGWMPDSFLYPHLPSVAIVLSTRAIEPVYRLLRGSSLTARIPGTIDLYDDLEPFGILLLARGLVFAISLATVVLAGLFARRLAGPAAGAAAALLAALAPALVLRGSIALIDPFAAFFALACLVLTERTRDARRPGLVSLAAGAMAGAAFASKYPAALVLIALPATTLLLRLPAREVLRRLALAALGFLLGVAVGMPGALLLPGQVAEALRLQLAMYAGIPWAGLWRQALVRAESDISYAHPELGIGFVALALGGLVVALRERRTRAAAAGWCTYAAASLLLFGTQTFQPFRNLLPLVPVACVSAALFYDALRRRVARAAPYDALAVAGALAIFAVPLAGYAWQRHELRDSRRLAVDWLAAHAGPSDRVLAIRDLGVLEQELARVSAAGQPSKAWLEEAGFRIAAEAPRFVLAGDFARLDGSLVRAAEIPGLASNYVLRFAAGVHPTAASRSWWRGNDQRVYVFESR